MKSDSWLPRISLAGFFVFIHAIVSLQAQSGTNENRLRQSLREIWVDGSWLNDSKAEYSYDFLGRQDQIVHTRWTNNLWQDTTVVTNRYDARGLLAEREERRLSRDFILSHELYEYDENGNLTLISFPDTPWFRARGLFNVYGIPFTTIIFVEPYLLTSHMTGIEFEYNASGLLNQIKYLARSDALPDSIFGYPKLHPLSTVRYNISEYSSTILTAYRDSLWSIVPVSEREITRIQKISYQTNGKQIAVLSYPNPLYAGKSTDLAWDFYDIWYPGEMRTLWFYSNDEASNSADQLMVAQFDPHKQNIFFRDLMTFWLSDADDAALYNVFVNIPGVQTRYFTSKIQSSASFYNSYIPGNYYQYRYEPRFRGSSPITNKRLLKTVEQVQLALQKLGSPEQYGFGWDHNNQWINSVERNYEYNESGNLVRSLINTWEWDRDGDHNPDTGSWQKDSKYELFYDETGNGAMIMLYRWNTDTGNWDNRERITFTYEVAGPAQNMKSKQFDLRLANHPNPFNARTVITFRLENPAVTSLKIYDLTGRLVRTILDAEKLSAAEHSFDWNGRDDYRRTVSSGLYLYRLESGNLRKTGRCLFVK